jgi:hypothetical protein
MLKWVCFKVWIVHELDCRTRIHFRFIHQISDPTYYVDKIVQVTAVEELDKTSWCRRDKKYRSGATNHSCPYMVKCSSLFLFTVPKIAKNEQQYLFSSARMTRFFPLLPTSFRPPTQLLTLVLRGIAQNTVRNWTRMWMRIIKVNIWYLGRIIGFYDKIHVDISSRVYAETFPAARYRRFLRNFGTY